MKFTLRYQELLKRKFGIYEHAIYVDPVTPVDDFMIEVFLSESKEISYLQVPPLRPIDPSALFNETGNKTLNFYYISPFFYINKY